MRHTPSVVGACIDLSRSAPRRTQDPRWFITEVNARYDVCPSYPWLLAMPAKTLNEDLVRAAGLWVNGRMPTWRWSHPRTRAWLCRASQPRVQP